MKRGAKLSSNKTKPSTNFAIKTNNPPKKRQKTDQKPKIVAKKVNILGEK